MESGSGKLSSHTILHLSGLSLAGRDDQPRHRVSRARCGNHRPGARTILCVSTLQKGDGCADHQTLLQTTLACGLPCPRHARVGRNPRSLATRSQRSQTDRAQAPRRCKHSSLSPYVGDPTPPRTIEARRICACMNCRSTRDWPRHVIATKAIVRLGYRARTTPFR